ncbi:hypothetical protein WJX79_002382 [Trebouxia sp. C0005]
MNAQLLRNAHITPKTAHSPQCSTKSKPAQHRTKSGRNRRFGRLSLCLQNNSAATTPVSTPVRAGTTPYGRGLLSCKQLSSGTRLLSTPFAELLLLPDKVEGPYEKVHEQFWRAHGSVPDELFRFITGAARWDLRLTAWLLWLSKYGSTFWRRYTASLPGESEMTCLLNYSPAEQPELQWLANEAAVQHGWATDSHESLFSSHTGHLKGLQLADSLQDTLWAMSLVRSRTFSDKVHDTEVALMVPTADLANHSFQYNSTYALRSARGAFELNSCRLLNAGDAICISYGSDKTNAELMRDYGFCVPGNPNDRLDFTSSDWQQHAGIIVKPATLLFKVLNSSPAPLKEEERPQLLAGPLLKALGLQGKLKAGKVYPEGMSSQQAKNGSNSESKFWPPKSFTDSGEPALRVTLTRKEKVQQRRAIDMLQRHCRSLQAWGTTLQSHEDLLVTESELSPRQRQAACARVEHKKLIEAAQSALQTYYEFLTDTAVLSRILNK